MQIHRMAVPDKVPSIVSKWGLRMKILRNITAKYKAKYLWGTIMSYNDKKNLPHEHLVVWENVRCRFRTHCSRTVERLKQVTTMGDFYNGHFIGPHTLFMWCRAIIDRHWSPKRAHFKEIPPVHISEVLWFHAFAHYLQSSALIIK